MNLPKGKKLLRMIAAGTLAASPLAGLAFSSMASAGSLTNVQVIFNNMATSATTSGTVCVKTSGTVGTEGKVDVTFPTGFTIDTTIANWTVNNTAAGTWPTTGAPQAWPSIAAPTGTITGQDVVFGSGDLTANTLYCFNWTSSTITQPSSAAHDEVGTVTTQTAGGSTIDSGQFATASLTSDTVNVTATVPPLFNFSVAPNSDPLGTLGTGTVSKSQSANRAVLTVNTNAKSGWTVWAKDANGGLLSTQASKTIAATTGTLSAGTEGFTTGVQAQAQTSGTGTVTIQSGWTDTSDNGTGVALSSTVFKPVAISNGTAGGSTLTMANSVAISATTPAATDYADTETYIAAGLF